MNHASSKTRERPLWKALAIALCAVSLAACASNDPSPGPALSASEASLEAARAAGASDMAAVPLQDARNKLERARALARDGNNREAIRLAEQAGADAQLARALAGSERSRRAAAEVEASLSALQQELARPSAAPSPTFVPQIVTPLPSPRQ